MTRDRRFKQAVRKLMRATGQNYLSARASLQPRESAVGGGEVGFMTPGLRAASGATRHEVIVKGEHDLFTAYMEEIEKIPAVTDEEAMQLGRQKEAGERADWYRLDWSKLPEAERDARVEAARRGRMARQRLTEANLRLVVSVARRYQGQGMRMLDLIKAGNEGLVHAVDKFDGTPEQLLRSSPGAPLENVEPAERSFSTFAVPWIRAALHRAIDVAQHPRVPAYSEAENNVDARKLRDLLGELPGRLGREPTVDEVAADLGFTAQRARRYASSMIAMLDVHPTEVDNERAERVVQPAKESEGNSKRQAD